MCLIIDNFKEFLCLVYQRDKEPKKIKSLPVETTKSSII